MSAVPARKERHGTAMDTPSTPCTTTSSPTGGHQHHQSHRPDLGHHDLIWRDGHHQQMLDGAMFAFADQGAPVR